MSKRKRKSFPYSKARPYPEFRSRGVVLLSDAEHEQCKRIAKRLELSMHDFYAEAIMAYVEEYEEQYFVLISEEGEHE